MTFEKIFAANLVTLRLDGTMVRRVGPSCEEELRESLGLVSGGAEPVVRSSGF